MGGRELAEEPDGVGRPAAEDLVDHGADVVAEAESAGVVAVHGGARARVRAAVEVARSPALEGLAAEDGLAELLGRVRESDGGRARSIL